MKPDKNITIYWNMEPPVMGCGFWPIMMGHLTSYGKSHYSNPSPNYFCPHVILKGRGTVRYSGVEYRVSPGDVFSIWPGQPIEYFDTPEYPWEFLWIHIVGDGTESFLNGCGFSQERLMFRPINPSGVKRLVWQIRSLYAKRDYAEIIAILGCFYELAVACGGKIASQSAQMQEHDIVKQATAYIDAMLHTSLDVNGIAAALGICRTTLYRAFVENTGVTPIEYLSSKRIERAKELLKTSSLPLGELCKTIGFSDQRYFIRCFRKSTGKTPGTFRNTSDKR